MTDNCSQNLDPLKLQREGTSQAQRYLAELAPSYVSVSEHGVEHAMVFAKNYAEFLKFYDSNHIYSGNSENWQGFFAEDVSVQLATVAIDDIEAYKTQIKLHFDFLNNIENQSKPTDLKQTLGYLFTALATLAYQLDSLKMALPADVKLRQVILNLITTKLAPAFKQLIGAYKAGHAHSLIIELPLDNLRILGGSSISFEQIRTQGLSADWLLDGALNWSSYIAGVPANHALYGVPNLPAVPDVFERINHVATHNLFTGIFDEFLKVYARVIKEAQLSLEDSYQNKHNHQPHYALFIAFLRLLEHARAEANTLTQRHLDFYYREVLQLKERAAVPANAHLLLELPKHVAAHELTEGTQFKAGQDALGRDVLFENSRSFVANQAKVEALKTIYRHGSEQVAGTLQNTGRVFASPIANSADGNGAAFETDSSGWHPFFNKIYQNGSLQSIHMPQANLGFAVASHYLLLAEGKRDITLTFNCEGNTGAALTSLILQGFSCLFTVKDGWFEVKPSQLTASTLGVLKVTLTGDDPAIIPFDAKVHGDNFASHLPVMQVQLKHDAGSYAYETLQEVRLQSLGLTVEVTGVKTLAISNDFGPVDAAQPFMPFGALPNGGESLVIGSKEMFQKNLTMLTFSPIWQAAPTAYPNSVIPRMKLEYLAAGVWNTTEINVDFTFNANQVIAHHVILAAATLVDKADLSELETYNLQAKHGFIRFKLDRGFGYPAYQLALVNYAKGASQSPPSAIVTPVLAGLSMAYRATQTIDLTVAGNFSHRAAYFYHLTPFGYAEQHAALKVAAPDSALYLFPQFKHQQVLDVVSTVKSEAEFYIGIAKLKPPQSVSLLFQVLDGSADPLTIKPHSHLQWSYLANNEWHAFAKQDVDDSTDGLLNSGIVKLAVPREATDNNTILAAGMHWIRVCVSEKSAATCKLLLVAAQALKVTFTDYQNDVNYQSNALAANTIAQLNNPTSNIKSVSQPFETFGGKRTEDANQFYMRVSERLRHKDRAIALWDFEHLVLEAFPQIYQVKCLNHTHYQATENGVGIYRELAAGHVTLVTIPNIQSQNINNPLRPYTSLGLLEEIKHYLMERQSGFVELHVANPEFEEVQLKFKLRLLDGFDEAFYVKKLQEALTQYLSPWLNADSASTKQSLTFGGRLYKSVLINFIEEQPYVDYITDVQLIHYYLDADGQLVNEEANEISGSKALSILVSKPANEHEITVIQSNNNNEVLATCGCAS